VINKAYRQTQIVKLIQQKRVHTQDELARELSQLGVQTTQVTLSRDIRELRLAKTSDGYVQLLPAVPKGRDFAAVAGEFLEEVKSAQNLVVLRTSPGNANALAVALDREEWPDVVGTLAGDDTVLVIAPDARTAEELHQKLVGLIR
jgi:transcriptional regulator of arginine metabolism